MSQHSQGTASREPAPFGPWPFFAEDEIQAARQVLESGRVNYWTGTEGRQFEEEYAAFTGTRHAIALSNGTVALELALYALGIGPGDDVIVPCRTFIASASCIVARGARPVVCDIDRDSQNLTRETIEAVITPQTRAIIAVHLAGWPCDMDPILELARERNLFVIEDCAQAHGAEYKGRPVGSLGHAGCFSFCQDKILTTAGEGGLLVTNDSQLWQTAWQYKDHGKTEEAFYHPAPPSTQFRWLHERFGTNFRMTEIQAAIGRRILQKLPGWIEQRRSNAARLLEVCQSTPALRTPVPGPDIYHAYYKFYTFLQSEHLAAGWDRDRLLLALRERGVPAFSGSCSEIYLEKAFPQEWRPAERFPVAKELGETSLMLLVHPTLSAANVDHMCGVLSDCLAQATGGASQSLRRSA